MQTEIETRFGFWLLMFQKLHLHRQFRNALPRRTEAAVSVSLSCERIPKLAVCHRGPGDVLQAYVIKGVGQRPLDFN